MCRGCGEASSLLEGLCTCCALKLDQEERLAPGKSSDMSQKQRILHEMDRVYGPDACKSVEWYKGRNWIQAVALLPEGKTERKILLHAPTKKAAKRAVLAALQAMPDYTEES